MKLRVILLAAFIFALCAWASKKEAPQTVIKVLVTNQFDKPVENAEVILDFLGSKEVPMLKFRKKVHWEVHTNQEGKATFPPVPQGSVQLQVNKKNYQTWGDKVEATGDEKIVEIKLSPPQGQYSVHAPLKPADEPPKNPQ